MASNQEFVAFVTKVIREFPAETNGRPSTAQDVKVALAGRVDILADYLGGRADDIPLTDLHALLDKMLARKLGSVEELRAEEAAARAKAEAEAKAKAEADDGSIPAKASANSSAAAEVVKAP